MKCVVIVGLLCTLLPASGFAGFGLPWFNTRPKPFLFDEPPTVVSKPPLRKPVAWSRDANEQSPSPAKSDSHTRKNKQETAPPRVKPETAQ